MLTLGSRNKIIQVLRHQNRSDREDLNLVRAKRTWFDPRPHLVSLLAGNQCPSETDTGYADPPKRPRSCLNRGEGSCFKVVASETNSTSPQPQLRRRPITNIPLQLAKGDGTMSPDRPGFEMFEFLYSSNPTVPESYKSFATPETACHLQTHSHLTE